MLQKGVGKICCVIPVVAAQRRSKRKVESGAAVPSCDLWMTPLLLVERVAFRTFPLAGKHFPGTFYWLDFAKLFSSQDQGHYYYEIFWAWSPALAWPFTALFCPFLSYSFYRWIWRQNSSDSVSILGVANGKIREERKTAFAALIEAIWAFYGYGRALLFADALFSSLKQLSFVPSCLSKVTLYSITSTWNYLIIV